jgi:hypothetical protein
MLVTAAATTTIAATATATATTTGTFEILSKREAFMS